MKNQNLLNLASKYSAQLGEISWHQFTLDPRIRSQSIERFNYLATALDKSNIQPTRILELCPNDRYTIHMLSEKYHCEAYGVDISARAMKRGVEIAESEGIKSDFYGIASDFHELPFPDNYFDLIYVYGSIHHTKSTSALISELIRCLDVEGIIFLLEEPVKRGACIYLFEGNRDSRSPYEKLLYSNEISNYVTAPFGGTRPEALFGMIENQEISLDTYLKALSEDCEIIDWCINDGDDWLLASSLDKYFIAEIKNKNSGAIDSIHSTLSEKFKACEGSFSNSDKLMDIRHPTNEQILDLSNLIYKHFKAIIDEESSNKQSIVSAFGGAIKISAKKTKNTSCSISNKESKIKFNRFTEYPLIVENLFIDLKTPKLVDLQLSVESEIKKSNIFPEEDWMRIIEENCLISYINKSNSIKINIQDTCNSGALVMRYYSVASVEPYKIDFFINEKLIESQWICQSETRLFKYFHAEPIESFVISFESLISAGVPPMGNIRVGYLQQFPIVEISQIAV